MTAPDKGRPGRRPDPAVRAAWQERLDRQARSGLSAAAFCSQQGLSLSAFHAWRRKLRPAPPPAPPALVPIQITAEPPAPVELALPTGATLRLRPGCDLGLVRSLLALLTTGGLPC